ILDSCSRPCRRKGGTGRTVRRPQRRGRGRDAHAHERSCRKPCEPTRPSRRGVTMISDAEDEGSSTDVRFDLHHVHLVTADIRGFCDFFTTQFDAEVVFDDRSTVIATSSSGSAPDGSISSNRRTRPLMIETCSTTSVFSSKIWTHWSTGSGQAVVMSPTSPRCPEEGSPWSPDPTVC